MTEPEPVVDVRMTVKSGVVKNWVWSRGLDDDSEAAEESEAVEESELVEPEDSILAPPDHGMHTDYREDKDTA